MRQDAQVLKQYMNMHKTIKDEMLLRRAKSSKMFKQYSDSGLEYSVVSLSENELVKQVIFYFKTESSLCYPAKYIFCNIIYSYYAEKYFNLPFYESLNWPELLADSPIEYLYKDHVSVYEVIIKEILPNIEHYENAIRKTRLYFKQEFCIFDESFNEII